MKKMSNYALFIEELDRCTMPIHRISNVTNYNNGISEQNSIVRVELSLYNLFALHTVILKTLKLVLSHPDFCLQPPTLFVEKEFSVSDSFHLSIVAENWAVVIDKNGKNSSLKGLQQIEHFIRKTFGLENIMLLVFAASSEDFKLNPDPTIPNYFSLSDFIKEWIHKTKKSLDPLSTLALTNFIDRFHELAISELITTDELSFFKHHAHLLDRFKEAISRFDEYRRLRVDKLENLFSTISSIELFRLNYFTVEINKNNGDKKPSLLTATTKGFELTSKPTTRPSEYDENRPQKMQIVLGYSGKRWTECRDPTENCLPYEATGAEIIKWVMGEV